MCALRLLSGRGPRPAIRSIRGCAFYVLHFIERVCRVGGRGSQTSEPKTLTNCWSSAGARCSAGICPGSWGAAIDNFAVYGLLLYFGREQTDRHTRSGDALRTFGQVHKRHKHTVHVHTSPFGAFPVGCKAYSFPLCVSPRSVPWPVPWSGGWLCEGPRS